MAQDERRKSLALHPISDDIDVCMAHADVAARENVSNSLRKDKNKQWEIRNHLNQLLA
jgi:hypothetical protein